jgi:hypothetical protein
VGETPGVTSGRRHAEQIEQGYAAYRLYVAQSTF